MKICYNNKKGQLTIWWWYYDFKNWYVGAGGVNQTVFNYYHGYECDYGIKDYDIVYFDEDGNLRVAI